MFRPKLGQSLHIGHKGYRFTEHPSAPGTVYAQSGRRGTVYQLVDEDGALWALKVFHPQYREPRLVGQAERIQPYASLPGLRACEREVLTSSKHVEVIREHMELAYAALMPWIEGRTWQELLIGREALDSERSLELARSLAGVLVGMEERGLAHCDLSGPNTLLPPDGGVQLVDLEEMYGADLTRPEALPGGSPGYAHRTAPEGLWHPKADRFAGAVLLAEILGWCDDRVREAAWGEGYFDPREVQTNCERDRLLTAVLVERCGSDVGQLLERAWQSESLLECPTFTEWLAALPDRSSLKGLSTSAAGRTPHPRVEQVLPTAEGVQGSRADRAWNCSHCGRQVSSDLSICPHCEQGYRPRRVHRSGDDQANETAIRADSAGRFRIPIVWVAPAVAAVLLLIAGAYFASSSGVLYPEVPQEELTAGTSTPLSASSPIETNTTAVATLELLTAAASATPEEMDQSCFHWQEITTSMEGQTLCAFGEIKRWFSTGDISYMAIFSEDLGTFVFIDRNATYPEYEAGTCVTATGRVQVMSLTRPYIDAGGSLNTCDFGSSSRPTATPLQKATATPTIAESTVVRYWQLVSQQRYEEAWEILSWSSRERNFEQDIDRYIEGYSTTAEVRVVDVNELTSTPNNAEVAADLEWVSKVGKVQELSMVFKLIFDASTSTWHIDVVLPK